MKEATWTAEDLNLVPDPRMDLLFDRGLRPIGAVRIADVRMHGDGTASVRAALYPKVGDSQADRDSVIVEVATLHLWVVDWVGGWLGHGKSSLLVVGDPDERHLVSRFFPISRMFREQP